MKRRAESNIKNILESVKIEFISFIFFHYKQTVKQKQIEFSIMLIDIPN